MVDNKFLPKLSQNLLEILDDDEYYDITIEVGNDPYVKIFRAHMVILNHRSPFLRRILSTNKKKNDGTLEHIKLSNILPETFQIILRYIYGGRLSLEEHDTSDIIKILISANELSLQELIPHLQSFLIKNKSNWMEQNFNLVYQMSFENNSFLELQKYCINLMSKEPEKIFNSPGFASISEKSLVSLIKHDNFQMNEIQVWEYVLKWGIAQNPELSSDPASYSKDDFNSLKNTLQQCIQFIKFRNLTSKEFSNKVLPYKKIFPKKLYKDLIKYFLEHDCCKSEKSESQIASRDYKGMTSHGSLSPTNDGWINVGGSSQRKDKVGDLTKFGSMSRGKITGNNFWFPFSSEKKERRESEEKTRKEQEEKEKEEIERKKREEKETESNDSKKEEKKCHRPGPLDLSRTTSAPAPLGALGRARAIDDINSVQYPEGISPPNPALNSNAEPGKFKYDRNFLMQFMDVCKEKPENLPVSEAIGMEEPKNEKRKDRRRSNSKNSSQFAVGEFKFPPRTSEERFAVANMRNWSGRTLGRTGGSGTTKSNSEEV